MNIQKYDSAVCDWVVQVTTHFVGTKWGKLFLGLSLVGPFTFLPTVWQAWTAENIDALRTMTWPLMTAINLSVFVAVCHNGDWRLRLCMVMWVILMALTWLATIVR